MKRSGRLKSIDVSGLPKGLGCLEPTVKRAARAVLREHKIEAYALSITFIADSDMSRLNRRALGRRGTTDVIAFDLADPGSPAGAVGDVYVSFDRALAQSVEFNVSLREELVRLVVHGVLHTVGYRDHAPAESRRMRVRQERVVRRLFDATPGRGGRGRG
jgi:probable rRNA maturation factor